MAESGHTREHAHEHTRENGREEVCSQCGEPGRGHTHDVEARPVVTAASAALVALLLVAAALAGAGLVLRRRGTRVACPTCRRFVSQKEGKCPLCGSTMEGARELPR